MELGILISFMNRIASMNEGNLEMFHFIHTSIDAQCNLLTLSALCGVHAVVLSSGF